MRRNPVQRANPLRKLRTLSRLNEYVTLASQACHVPLAYNWPVFGEDAFRTGTGVHAAAIIKAFKRSDPMLANMVYSGVPSHLFGLEQVIEIGPLSGHSNVQYWLERHDIAASEELVLRIFETAKHASRVLTDEEILALCGRESSH